MDSLEDDDEEPDWGIIENNQVIQGKYQQEKSLQFADVNVHSGVSIDVSADSGVNNRKLMTSNDEHFNNEQENMNKTICERSLVNDP